MTFYSKLTGERRGVSLIEMVVYLAITVTIIYTLESFFVWTIRSNIKSRVQKEVTDSARRAMETLVYEIKEAESIYTPTSLFDTGGGQLSLVTRHNLPSDEALTYADFYLCGQQLCLKRESAAAIAVTSEETVIDNLSFFRFTAGEAEAVQINLNLRYNNQVDRPEWQASTTLTTTITLRDY